MRWINRLCSGFKNGETVSGEIHHTKVKNWRWPNFAPQEIACKGTGLILIDEHALDCLQKFRDLIDQPIIINSAYRSEAHNNAVGGAKNSQHRLGKAFDIRITTKATREDIKKYAIQAGFTGIGDYKRFVHIDTGRERYWDLRS